MTARLIFLAATFLQLSCNREPQWYPIPPQHNLPPGSEPITYADHVRVGEPDSDMHLVQDFGPIEGAGWRWTGARPQLRFRLDTVTNRRFYADFTIHDTTFKDTGPLTIAYLVNGHQLARVTYKTSGDKKFEKLVPEAWLKPGEETMVVIDIENPWIAPADKAKMGVVFREAGFLK